MGAGSRIRESAAGAPEGCTRKPVAGCLGSLPVARCDERFHFDGPLAFVGSGLAANSQGSSDGIKQPARGRS
jgi:hypothetical protein